MKSSKQYIAAVCLVALITLLGDCELWGSLDNPADPDGTNYQGYNNETDPNVIKPVIAATGTVAFMPKLVAVKIVNADKYNFQIASDDVFNTIVHDKEYATNEYLPTDFPAHYAAGTYYWRVCATKNSVRGSWSTSTATFRLSATLSNTNLPDDTTTISDTTPNVDWSDVAGAAGYRFELSTDATFATTTTDVSTLIISEYKQTVALINGATYYWHIAAKNADGAWGTFTSTRSFTIDLSKPGLISPADIAAISDTKPAFDWSDVAEAVNYRFQLSKDSNFTTTATDVSNLAASGYTQTTELTPGSTYYWRVKIKNIDEVWGEFTSTRSFTIAWNPVISVIAPTNNEIITDTTPLLNWNDASGTTSYKIQIADSVDGLESAQVVSTSSSQYQITSALPNGATRHWRVAPVNPDGVVSAWQGPWSFTIKISAGISIGDETSIITITLSGGLTPFYDGQTMTITATANPTPDSYLWYLDGKLQTGQIGQSLTVLAVNIRVGYHTVLCKAIKGTSTSSATFSFDRIEADDAMISRERLIAEYLFSGNVNELAEVETHALFATGSRNGI